MTKQKAELTIDRMVKAAVAIHGTKNHLKDWAAELGVSAPTVTNILIPGKEKSARIQAALTEQVTETLTDFIIQVLDAEVKKSWVRRKIKARLDAAWETAHK